MRRPKEAFGKHLVPDEPLQLVASGRFVDDTDRRRVSIGLTDRRLLCLFDGNGFADVRYDHVCSIRSRPKRRATVRGNDYRIPVVVGGLLAYFAFVGLIGSTAGPQTPRSLAVLFLSVVAVAGIVVAEYVRREYGYDVLWEELRARRRAWTNREERDETGRRSFPRLTRVRSGLVGTSGTFRRRLRRYVAGADRQQLAATGGALAGLLSSLAAVGTAVLASSVLVPCLLLVLVAGMALADYGYRNRDRFDGVDLIRRYETVVSVSTLDGRTISLVFDSNENVDRKLGKLVRSDDSTHLHPGAHTTELASESSAERPP